MIDFVDELYASLKQQQCEGLYEEDPFDFDEILDLCIRSMYDSVDLTKAEEKATKIVVNALPNNIRDIKEAKKTLKKLKRAILKIM
jgi:hypothetical protein